MGVHPFMQSILDDMRRIPVMQQERAPEPVPANDGPRTIGSLLPSIVSDIHASLTSFEPRYFVRDGLIVTASSGRTQTAEKAREALAHYVEDALTVPHADLVDIDVIHIVHLIHAIREAEGTDPTPPAAIARAA